MFAKSSAQPPTPEVSQHRGERREVPIADIDLGPALIMPRAAHSTLGKAMPCDSKSSDHPRAAAKIDDRFAGLHVGKMEVITDAGKGLDRRCGNTVKVYPRIAETLGHRAPHLEVEIAVRILGDAPLHRLYLGFQLFGVERHNVVMSVSYGIV